MSLPLVTSMIGYALISRENKCDKIRGSQEQYSFSLIRGGIENTRPRTQKKPMLRTDFPRTDCLEAKDWNARDQEHDAQVFSKKEKKDLRSKIRKFSVKFQVKKKRS